MAACAACNTTILFGGVRNGSDRFCNTDCQSRAYLVLAARQIPPDVLREQTSAVYRGMCPQCQGPGPIDVHTSYRIWSAGIVTSWRSLPRISCRPCGVKAQLGSTLFSLLLGWWGFPWGFIMTPVQIFRNVRAMLRRQESQAPSADLERLVGVRLAAGLAARSEG